MRSAQEVSLAELYGQDETAWLESMADLAAHRLVHYAGSFGQRAEGWEYPLPGGGHASLAMAGAITVDGGEAYVGAALAGLGLIQVPRLGVYWALEQGRLVEVLTEDAFETPIQMIAVASDADAAMLEMRGSPTIRIDGVDIHPESAGDIGLEPREYGGDGPVPSKARIRRAVERARGWSHGVRG